MLRREWGEELWPAELPAPPAGLWPVDTPPLEHPDGRQLAGLELVGLARARDEALQRFRTAAFDALRYGAGRRDLEAIVRAEIVEATRDDPTPPDDRPRQGPRTPV